MRAGALLLVPLLFYPACRADGTGTRRNPAASDPTPQAPSPDERIAAVRARLERHPRLDPAWAELGEAWLDKARATRDPQDVRRAREAFERSLELQENFIALRGMAALANFRHRFEEAIAWAEKAQAAYPEDTSVAAMRVEALLTLGRVDEADRTLAGRTIRSGEVHLRAARARVLLARGRLEEAVSLYLEAAGIARDAAPGLAQWAIVRAAAAFVDSGSPERARPLLLEALALGPASIDANVHQAEVEEACGDLRGALARYDSLLREGADPAVLAAAARVARRLGDSAGTTQRFRAAESVFRRAVDAGELYTLGALARLYLDADDRLDEALALARRNADVQRTPEARDLVERIRIAREAR